MQIVFIESCIHGKVASFFVVLLSCSRSFSPPAPPKRNHNNILCRRIRRHSAKDVFADKRRPYLQAVATPHLRNMYISAQSGASELCECMPSDRRITTTPGVRAVAHSRRVANISGTLGIENQTSVSHYEWPHCVCQVTERADMNIRG